MASTNWIAAHNSSTVKEVNLYSTREASVMIVVGTIVVGTIVVGTIVVDASRALLSSKRSRFGPRRAPRARGLLQCLH